MTPEPVLFLTQAERDQAAAIAEALSRQLIDALEPVLTVRRVLAPPLEAFAGTAPFMALVDGTTPDAGDDYVYQVAGGVAATPLSVLCELETSGVAGDRMVAVEYRDGNGDPYLIAGAPVAVTATSTQRFCWHPQAGASAWPVEDAAIAPLPVQAIYGPCQIAVRVWDGDAGDQLSGVRLSLELVALPF